MNFARTCLLGLLAASATCAMAGGPQEIVGGKPAPDGRYPWMVPLLVQGVADNFKAQWCGGSLVSPTKVLTAAHCLGQKFDILIGSQDLKSGEGRRVRVASSLAHPQYRSKDDSYDLAILTLAEPVYDVTPVRFISTLEEEAQYMPDDRKLTVVGYGNTRSGGKPSSTLLQVKVPVVNRDTCNKAPMYARSIGDTEFCAGYVEGGKDSCQGDSGGPIFRRGKTAANDVQVGIVSWGYGCAVANKPGVYDRLGVTGQWVKDQIALP